MKKYKVKLRRDVPEVTTVEIWADDYRDAMAKAPRAVQKNTRWEPQGDEDHKNLMEIEVDDIEEIDLGDPLAPALYEKGWERLHTGGGCWSLLWQIEPDGPYYLISDQDSGIEIYEKEWSFGHYDAEGCQTWFVTSDQFPALTLTDFLASLNLPEREPNQYELGGGDDDASS